VVLSGRARTHGERGRRRAPSTRRGAGRAVTAGAWLIGLYPLGRVGWWLRDGIAGLGANPIERVLHHTGWWALTLLLVTLAVTPARRLTGRNELVRARRPIGLFAFFYASLHLATYLFLDQLLAWRYIVEDVTRRPFITVGLLAWTLLLPLAVTSTRGWMARLGRDWTRLHRLVYLATALGLLHYFWKVRADTRVPVLYAILLIGLLAARVAWTRRRSPAKASHESDGPRGAGPAAACRGETGAGARPR
jgi:methionine sulfoxide reductase heme-binding subunit